MLSIVNSSYDIVRSILPSLGAVTPQPAPAAVGSLHPTGIRYQVPGNQPGTVAGGRYPGTQVPRHLST